MAQIPFTYNGQQYTVDDATGSIYRNGQALQGDEASNIGLWQSAALATNDARGTSSSVAPPPAAPVTPSDSPAPTGSPVEFTDKGGSTRFRAYPNGVIQVYDTEGTGTWQQWPMVEREANSARNSQVRGETPTDFTKYHQEVTDAAQHALAGGPTLTTAPTPGTQPTSPPAATPPSAQPGISAPASVHQTGTTSLTPPAPTTNSSNLPSSPPRSGIGSATELRTQRDSVQKQLDDLNKIPIEDRTNSQNSLLSSLNTRISALTDSITKAETPAPKSPTLRSTGGTDEPYNIIDNNDGTITAVPNQNYKGDGQIKPQVVSQGNNTFVVTPATAAELAKDPAAQPHVTVAYTDKDAAAIAQGTLAVAQANNRVSAAAQATNDFAAHAKADLDERVSKGEDAASIRAEQTLKLQQLHQEWMEADGDARRAQTSADSYNANRHNVALESQGQQTIDNTAAAQARQDATQRYGYDKSAETSRYATDSAANTAKLQAATTLWTNSLSTLAEINKDLPPGSDLAGKALEGMLAYGQKFLDGFSAAKTSKPGDTTTTPTDPTAGVPGAPVLPDVSGPAATAPASSQPYETSAQSAARNGAALDQQNAASSIGAAIAGAGTGTTPTLPTAGPVNAPPVPAPTSILPPGAVPLASTAGASVGAQLAAQNAAAHQATMAAPVAAPARLAPDGTPYATAADVARIFGRGGTA